MEASRAHAADSLVFAQLIRYLSCRELVGGATSAAQLSPGKLCRSCTGAGRRRTQLRGCPPWRPRAAYSPFMPLR
jgi:hypothetical protein